MTSDAPVNPIVKPIVIDGQTTARLCSIAFASVDSFASSLHVNDVLNLTLIKNFEHSVEFCSMSGHLETQCQSVFRISVTTLRELRSTDSFASPRGASLSVNIETQVHSFADAKAKSLSITVHSDKKTNKWRWIILQGNATNVSIGGWAKPRDSNVEQTYASLV